VIVLDPAAAGALTLSGGAQINANAPVLVDSNNAAAVSGIGNTQLNAPTIAITGGYSLAGQAALNGQVSTGVSPTTDPLAGVAAPDPSQLPLQSSAPIHFSNGSHTLQPGLYQGGITISGGSLTMMPGLYYLDGGGLTASGSSSIVGNGVTIYDAPHTSSEGTRIAGSVTLTLSPPTSGPYQGIVFFQDRASDAPFTLTGGSATNISGTVYLADAPAVLRRGSGVAQVGSQFISRTLKLSGNGTLDFTYDPSVVASGGTSGGSSGGSSGGASGGTSGGGSSGGTSGGSSGGATGGATGSTLGGSSGGTNGGSSGGSWGGATGGATGVATGGTSGGAAGGASGGATGGTTGGTSGGASGNSSGGTAGGTNGGTTSGASAGATGNSSGGATGGAVGSPSGGTTEGTSSLSITAGAFSGGSSAGPWAGATGGALGGTAGSVGGATSLGGVSLAMGHSGNPFGGTAAGYLWTGGSPAGAPAWASEAWFGSGGGSEGPTQLSAASGGTAGAVAQAGSAAPPAGADPAAPTQDTRTSNGGAEPAPQNANTGPGLRLEAVDAVFASGAAGWHFEPEMLWSNLDKMGEQVNSTAPTRSRHALLAAAFSLLTAVGFIACRLCNHYLLASSAAGSPLWKRAAEEFDPLAILDSWEGQSNQPGEKESLQSLVA
jgi:hypothetical protein